MLGNLLIGVVLMVVNLGIQVVALVFLIRYFARRIGGPDLKAGAYNDIKIVSLVMVCLIVGHMFMFATWAVLFLILDEFQDFQTAYYHSVVNFTSLGYGDIVMSESRRLLGALEAANGVLMFSLSSGAILSVLNRLFSRHSALSTINSQTGD